MGFLSTQSILPPGTVLPYAGSAAPTGWALCQGQALSRPISAGGSTDLYIGLYAALGTTYGVGDGSTTFNLPNAQGVFLRGAGSQTISAITYSGTRGTTQNDNIKTHKHLEAGYLADADANLSYTNANGTVGVGSGNFYDRNQTSFTRSRVYGDPQSGAGAETQPANISVNYIIKL